MGCVSSEAATKRDPMTLMTTALKSPEILVLGFSWNSKERKRRLPRKTASLGPLTVNTVELKLQSAVEGPAYKNPRTPAWRSLSKATWWSWSPKQTGYDDSNLHDNGWFFIITKGSASQV